MFARSRLLYWKTSGISSSLIPISARFVPQVGERLDVGVLHRALRVGDEHDAVDALEHELARRVVEDLAGNRVELDAGLESADHPDVEGQQVEEERPVRLGLERNHLAARTGRRPAVDVVEVGGLSAQTGAVVHDLGRHLHRGVVEENHAASASAGARRAAAANCNTLNGLRRAGVRSTAGNSAHRAGRESRPRARRLRCEEGSPRRARGRARGCRESRGERGERARGPCRRRAARRPR